MIKQIQTPSRSLLFKSAATICALTACASSPEIKQAPSDTRAIKQIEFKLGTIKQASLRSILPQQDIVARVSKNLAEWGYPIGIKDNRAVSHILTAEIGLIELGETPTGFSFSIGNADPRAIDFQKMDVLPIGCELTSIEHPEQTTYLHMDFAAGHAISADKLVDNISTVCFNLLDELNWADKTQDQPVSSLKPSWVPAVRIETVSNPGEEGEANVPGKPVTSTHEGRKQIVIQNQGSPVIFSFGHERR